MLNQAAIPLQGIVVQGLYLYAPSIVHLTKQETNIRGMLLQFQSKKKLFLAIFCVQHRGQPCLFFCA